MASILKVDKLDPQSGTALEIGTSGDTITIPSGAPIVNSGTATGFGGDNTPAFQAGLSSTQTITQDTATKVTCETELFDTDGTYDNSSNYRWTPAVAAKYFVYGVTRTTTSNDYSNYQLSIRKNGTGILLSNRAHWHYGSAWIYGIVDSNTTDYFELFVYQDDTGTVNVNGDPSVTYFGGYKIIT